MALADAIQAARMKPGTKCTIGEIADQLNKDDRAALTAAFLDKKVSAIAIVKALTAEGWPATRSPIERHRRQECACGTL